MLTNIFKNKFTNLKTKINPFNKQLYFSYLEKNWTNSLLYFLKENQNQNQIKFFFTKKNKENNNNNNNNNNENPEDNIKNKFNINDLLKIFSFLLLISFNENKKMFCYKASNKELERASNTIENDIKNLEFKYGGTLKREPIK